MPCTSFQPETCCDLHVQADKYRHSQAAVGCLIIYSDEPVADCQRSSLHQHALASRAFIIFADLMHERFVTHLITNVSKPIV